MVTNMHPAQLRTFIDTTRTNMLRVEQLMEVYEMYVYDYPGLPRSSAIQGRMKNDLVLLREKLRAARAKTHHHLQVLEEALTNDAAIYGWKGEDRLVELCR